MLALIPFAKKFFSRMVVAVLVTTLLSGFGIVAVNRMIHSRFDNLKRTEVNVAQDTGAGEPANFLLIGSDTRSFVSNDKDKQSFTDSDGETGQRSDTMMIIRVDPKAKRTLVMAIPRDLRVDIPGIGIQKINASFNQDLGGGPEKVIETIKSNFDIDIQHYVELDFDSFRNVVSALGTVNVYFPAPARDLKSGLNTYMQKGCIALDGEAALSYVRSRYYQQYIDGKWQTDPTSNYGRIARQQEFMKRVATVAVKKSLTDPLKGRDVSDSIIKNLQVDQDLSKQDIYKLMNAFNGVDPNDPTRVSFQTLPVQPKTISGISFDVLQEREAEPLLEEFRNLESGGSSNNDAVKLPRPSTVKVQVLNSTGTKGLASTAMTSFQEIGFAPAGTGNATLRSVTEIRYSPQNKNKALLVSQYIGGTLVLDSSITGADVTVILGKDFKSVSTKAQPIVKDQVAGDVPTTTIGKTQEVNSGIDETVNCPA